MNKQQVRQLKYDLTNTTLTFAELAAKYKVSYRSITRINCGDTYRDSTLSYPLRRTGTIQPNHIAFIQHYQSYSPKLIQLILNDYHIETIRKWRSSNPIPYTIDPILEERREVVDLMRRPYKELFHTNGLEDINYQDALYVKLLAYLGTPLIEILWADIENINFELTKCGVPTIDDPEMLQLYLDWDATCSKVAAYIKKLYYGFYNSTEQKKLDYRDFDFNRFGGVMSQNQIDIARSIIK